MSENLEENDDDFYLIDPCSICLEMVHKQEMKMLDCGHYFHCVCIDEWISVKMGSYPCPMCLRIFDSAEIITIQPIIEETITRQELTTSLDREYRTVCQIFMFLFALISFVIYLLITITPP